MIIPARYGTATSLRFFLVKRGVVDLAATADWTPATGDTKISKDGGNFANSTNNPSAIGGAGSVGWTLSLTASEMQANEVLVQIVDSATKAVEDQALVIRTMPAPTYDAMYGGIANVNLVDAPVVVSRATQAFDADATSHAITMPTTVHVGDLLIVVFANDGNATVTTPTAWTQLSTTVNGAIARLSTYAKVADGTEGGTTVDFVTSATEQGSSIVLRIAAGTYYPYTSTLGIAVGTAATGTSTTPDPPSVTIPWEAQNSLVIACYGADDQAQATAYPSNYQNGTTKQGANAAGASCGTAEQVLAATSENPGTFTIASQEWIAQTLIVRPDRLGDSLITQTRRGLAQTGAAGSITLDANASGSDSFYNFELVALISGTGVGQTRVITGYTGSTKVATVAPNWTTTPDTTTEFVIKPMGRIDVGYWLETLVTAATAGIPDVNTKNINNAAVSTSSAQIGVNVVQAGATAWNSGAITSSTFTAGAIDAAALATDAITSAELSTTAVNEIRDAILSDSTSFAGANIALIKAKTDNLPASPAAVADIAAALDATIADSVPADGTRPSVRQALYMLTQFMLERSVSSTTVTVKKVDGSTSLFTLTLNDATTPTSITRAT